MFVCAIYLCSANTHVYVHNWEHIVNSVFQPLFSLLTHLNSTRAFSLRPELPIPVVLSSTLCNIYFMHTVTRDFTNFPCYSWTMVITRKWIELEKKTHKFALLELLKCREWVYFWEYPSVEGTWKPRFSWAVALLESNSTFIKINPSLKLEPTMAWRFNR